MDLLCDVHRRPMGRSYHNFASCSFQNIGWMVGQLCGEILRYQSTCAYTFGAPTKNCLRGYSHFRHDRDKRNTRSFSMYRKAGVRLLVILTVLVFTKE